MSDAATGRYFEDFVIGSACRHAIRKTISEADSLLFSTLTYGMEPLHVDQAYAEAAPYGMRAVNSILLLGLACGIGAAGLARGLVPGTVAFSDVRFTRPVFIGDTIHVESEVLDKRDDPARPDAGLIELERRAYNQRNEVVAKFRCLQRLPRRHPAG
ncbi:Mesaconyl-CoA hydratase [compost metagenome]